GRSAAPGASRHWDFAGAVPSLQDAAAGIAAGRHDSRRIPHCSRGSDPYESVPRVADGYRESVRSPPAGAATCRSHGPAAETPAAGTYPNPGLAAWNWEIALPAVPSISKRQASGLRSKNELRDV